MDTPIYLLGSHTRLPTDIGPRISIVTAPDKTFRCNTNSDGYFLYINKPNGVTSNSINNRVRRTLNRRDTGFSGTLDPFATGLLIIGVGTATRLLDLFHHMPKTYRATACIGASSTTLDSTGEIKKHSISRPPIESDIIDSLQKLLGEREQSIPAFSAKKIDGVPLYKHARAGNIIENITKKIRVDIIKFISYEFPYITFEVTVSSGTFIRSLCKELGELLGTHAYCSQLCRTQIGPVKLEMAIDYENSSDVHKINILDTLENINTFLYKKS